MAQSVEGGASAPPNEPTCKERCCKCLFGYTVGKTKSSALSMVGAMAMFGSLSVGYSLYKMDIDRFARFFGVGACAITEMLSLMVFVLGRSGVNLNKKIEEQDETIEGLQDEKKKLEQDKKSLIEQLAIVKSLKEINGETKATAEDLQRALGGFQAFGLKYIGPLMGLVDRRLQGGSSPRVRLGNSSPETQRRLCAAESSAGNADAEETKDADILEDPRIEQIEEDLSGNTVVRPSGCRCVAAPPPNQAQRIERAFTPDSRRGKVGAGASPGTQRRSEIVKSFRADSQGNASNGQSEVVVDVGNNGAGSQVAEDGSKV